jgi:aryl-alcohol dehydrogenase-like predicted oxidoreductase
MPQDVTLPELALRFILSNPDVSVTIPGMRKTAHVRDNIAASDAGALHPSVLDYLRANRWDREPTDWSS